MIYQKQDKLIKGLAKYYGQDLFDYLEALEKKKQMKYMNHCLVQKLKRYILQN